LFFKPKKTSLPLLLIPGGDAFGIRLKETCVSVIAAKGDSAFRKGDRIISLDGEDIDSIEDVTRVLSDYKGGTIRAKIIRGGEEITLTVMPRVFGEGYKLGVTLRDTASGIGTLTFIDPASGAYGGLGHGVSTSDGGVLPISSGVATGVILGGIKRGEAGKPGELSGILSKTHLGSVEFNTDCGVFGIMDECELMQREAIPLGRRSEVKLGAAEIISTVKNGKRQSYKIEITEILEHGDRGSKSFKIKVTDPTLITLTGGIVRGMSGSPIIQDGKLVGAVTHVLVANPTEGYGIFIENMLNASEVARNELPNAA
jgi:stage IV sporulation protein B